MKQKAFKQLMAAVVLPLVSAIAQAAPVELVTNGGFENGDFYGTWAASNATISTVNPSSGIYSASLYSDSPVGASIKQNVSSGFLTPGQSVTVSFDYRGSEALGGVFFAQLHSIDGVGGVSFTDNIVVAGTLAPNPVTWATHSITTTLGPDVTGGFDILLVSTCGAVPGCLSDWYIDNVSVTIDVAAVPVPAAVWLFGSGLVGLVGVARRRKA